MTQPLLSILIPSTPDRKKDLSNILECISEQAYNRKVDIYDIGSIIVSRYWDLLSEVEVLVFEDAKIMTIGEKRELMYKHAKGLYSIQIDSDDLISDNAIELILNAIKVHELILPSEDIDCITFEEHIEINGKIEKSNHSLIYGDWEGEGGKELWDGFHYHRTPFFKSVIKTEIAISVPIPHIRFGEDHQWAQTLKPHLKTEFHMPEQLYKYIHISTPHNERYGFDRQ